MKQGVILSDAHKTTNGEGGGKRRIKLSTLERKGGGGMSVGGGCFLKITTGNKHGQEEGGETRGENVKRIRGFTTSDRQEPKRAGETYTHKAEKTKW